MVLATHTKVVIGTFTGTDTEATAGSIAKAINDITNGTATVESVSVVILSSKQMAAVIVYT